MIDIFSRKAIRWEVHYGESGVLANAFMRHAIAANGGTTPRYIHADNGTSMTSEERRDAALRPEHHPQPFPARTYPTTTLTPRPHCRVAGRDLTCPPPQIRT